jgi:hypothetical protein
LASHRYFPGSSSSEVRWDFGGHNGTGEGFIRVLLFPLYIVLPTATNSTLSVIRSGKIGQTVGDVTSGLNLKARKKETECIRFDVFTAATMRISIF